MITMTWRFWTPLSSWRRSLRKQILLSRLILILTYLLREDMEDDYDDMEVLDPTLFMEEITEEVDTALEMDVDVDVSAENGDMEGVGPVDHIEIEEPPETE